MMREDRSDNEGNGEIWVLFKGWVGEGVRGWLGGRVGHGKWKGRRGVGVE